MAKANGAALNWSSMVMSGMDLNKVRAAERSAYVDPRDVVPPMSAEERANTKLGPRHMIAASWKGFMPGKLIAVQHERAVERRGNFMSIFRLAQKLFPEATISIRCLEPQPPKDPVSSDRAALAAAEKVE